MLDASHTGASLTARGALASVVAARHAADVDKVGRFPAEAIATMKAERLLGAMVPLDLGGEGASLGDIAEICSIVGQHCSSAGMVYAMHQIQVQSLMQHARSSEWHRVFLRRVADEQLLLASATSETGVGGDLRTSLCAVEHEGDQYRLEKNALRHLLWRGRRCDPRDRAPRARLAIVRPGPRRRDEGSLQAHAHVRLGHDGHAGHLLGGLPASGIRPGHAHTPGAFRRNRRALHARDLAPSVGGALAWYRARRGPQGAVLRPRGSPQAAGRHAHLARSASRKPRAAFR